MEKLLIKTRFCFEISRIVNGQQYFIPKIERYIKRHNLEVDNLSRYGVFSTRGNLKEANQRNNMFHFLESLYNNYHAKNDILKNDGTKWERTNRLVFFSNNDNFTDVIQYLFNDFEKHFESKMLENSEEVFLKRQASPVIELLKQFDTMLINHNKTLMTINHCLPYDNNNPNTSNSFSWYLFTIELAVKQAKDLIYRHYPELEISQPKQIEEEISNKITTVEHPAQHLKDLFIDETHYNKVIDILIKKNYIEKDTLIWKDEKKGSKQFLVGLIKSLHFKDFFNKKPHYNEIILICKNTFKVVVSKSTIDKTNENSFNYEFIPISSDLK